jgi:hypothetical protein
MSTIIVYGIGGFCEDCDSTHDHPLNNVVEHYEIEDPEPTQEELNRQSAFAKLEALGLTHDEINAIISKVQ